MTLEKGLRSKHGKDVSSATQFTQIATTSKQTSDNFCQHVQSNNHKL